MAGNDAGINVMSDTTGRMLADEQRRMNTFLQRIADATEKNAGEQNLTTLEKNLATAFDLARDGKVYRTRFYFYSTNSTSKGTKMDDNEGMAVPTPATDTVKGSDPYQERQVFKWFRCNYTRDADRVARVSVLKGWPGYRETGPVDVGTLMMTFYWNIDVKDTYYDVIFSDSPHPELGLVPWIDAVKADGTVLPYYIESAFYSTVASDGLQRSQKGSPVCNQSYNNMIDNYAKKGAGYSGAGVSRNTLQIIFLAIKYAVKNSQQYFQGVTNYNTQPKCAVAETDVKRVVLASQGAFVVGGTVSVGVPYNGSTDRGNGTMHSVVDRKRIKSIETVSIDGKSYTALNLDIDSTITTTTDDYVSTMPAYSGWTDDVIGICDGSPVSNTDAKHPYRIQGIEYLPGLACIASDVVMDIETDYQKAVYVAERGTEHVKNAHTGYKLIGKIPAIDANNSDFYSGDYALDTATGGFYPATKGSGQAIGTGDIVWAGGKNTGLREYYMNGNLGAGGYAGACYVNCRYGLGNAGWAYGSCD